MNLTTTHFNVNTVEEHECLGNALKRLLPLINNSSGWRIAEGAELDVIVYDLLSLNAEDNLAAVFSNSERLLEVVSWVPLGTCANFEPCSSFIHVPYRDAGAAGTPESIVITRRIKINIPETISFDLPCKYMMNFITQLALYGLIDNPTITNRDNILVYFAGAGVRYDVKEYFHEDIKPIDAICPIDRGTDLTYHISLREIDGVFSQISWEKGAMMSLDFHGNGNTNSGTRLGN
ncbi:uncharacterized protein ARMOST_18546 [Armillaria ostoyae]|uniref:Uncharacterized protein n=1 Tax=Armillaria ostoyae TaxID=47428 RepID=A0A284S258_ARMOS|nr:uncharacterized protein ARMOST_18546 [Armillaria ostoyae]